MFGLEQLLMQVASTGSASMDSIVAIVIAVASIAGVVGGLLKQNAKTNRVGQYIDTFAQKTLEQEENMKRGFMAASAVSPELKEQLKKYDVPLADIEKRIEAAQAQLEFFRGKLPDKSQAESVTELPREHNVVKIKRGTDTSSPL